MEKSKKVEDRGRSVDITVVLDRSGSMELIRDDTIGGFNTFLEEQKKTNPNARITLVQFNDFPLTIFAGKKVRDVQPLTRDTFKPGGWTALLDAVGTTIDHTGSRLASMPAEKRPDLVMFIIITDGQENTSKIFNKDQVKAKITHQTDWYKWDFVFLGANMDAVKVGATYGIPWTKSMNWGNNHEGVGSTFSTTASYVTRTSAAASPNTTFFTDEERKKAMGSTNI